MTTRGIFISFSWHDKLVNFDLIEATSLLRARVMKNNERDFLCLATDWKCRKWKNLKGFN